MKEIWDQRYATGKYVYGTEPNVFFRKFIDTMKPGRILLPGEGEGRNAVYAAKQGWETFAFDQSNEAMKKANRLADENNVSIDYSVCDLTGYLFPKDYFDMVAIVYFHLPESVRPYFFNNVRNCIKPGGWIITEVFSKIIYPDIKCGPPLVDMRYDKKEILDYFKDYEIVQCLQKDVALDEGEFHRGTANVIRLAAKKP